MTCTCVGYTPDPDCPKCGEPYKRSLERDGAPACPVCGDRLREYGGKPVCTSKRCLWRVAAETALLCIDSWAGRNETRVEVANRVGAMTRIRARDRHVTEYTIQAAIPTETIAVKACAEEWSPHWNQPEYHRRPVRRTNRIKIPRR